MYFTFCSSFKKYYKPSSLTQLKEIVIHSLELNEIIIGD